MRRFRAQNREHVACLIIFDSRSLESRSRVLAFDELFAKRCCSTFLEMADGRPQSDERAQEGRALTAAPDGRASSQEQRNVDDALGYRESLRKCVRRCPFQNA